MKEKKIFTVIYLLLLVSVVGNVMFFVNWLGSHSKQEKKSQEQAELVMTLEEENTQLKSRIDELLTTESEADSSFGEENTQVTDPGEEEATVELPESNEKQVPSWRNLPACNLEWVPISGQKIWHNWGPS